MPLFQARICCLEMSDFHKFRFIPNEKAKGYGGKENVPEMTSERTREKNQNGTHPLPYM